MTNSSATDAGAVLRSSLQKMWNSLSSLVDEVASLLGTMQSLPMPWRPSANVTGLFAWSGEGVQMRRDQSTLT